MDETGTMKPWIEQRIAKFKKTFGDRLHEHEYEWIEAVLESAWDRGNGEGRNQAFELLEGLRTPEVSQD